jgi:uncharacterized repeat protein (TIGR02543 family)
VGGTPAATVTSDVTYTAQWTEKGDIPYVVKYYQKDLGAVTYTEVTTDKDDKTGVTNGTASPTVKSYTGFTLAKTTYEDSAHTIEQTDVLPIAGDGKLVIKLYYDREKYTVTYAPGTHSDFTADAHQNIEYGATTPTFAGATETGKTTPKAQTGYEFTGWDTVGGTPAATVTSDVTYTAQWAGRVYIVTYNKNADDADGTIGTKQATFATSFTTEQTGFTRPGHELAGWSTQLDGGSSVYTPGQAFTYTTPGNITLHAQWAAKTVTVSYKKNYSSSDTDNYTIDATKKYDEKLTAPNAPSRTGYAFGGWYKDAACTTAWNFNAYELTTTNGVQGADTDAPALALYAQWTANTTAITLNAGYTGGTGGTVTATYDEATLTGYTALTRTGYTLDGYFTASTGGTKVIETNGTLVSDAAGYTTDGNWTYTGSSLLTLYAQWTAAQSNPGQNNGGNNDPGDNGNDDPDKGDDPNDNGSDVENGNDGSNPDGNGDDPGDNGNDAPDDNGDSLDGDASAPANNNGSNAAAGGAKIAATGNAANIAATGIEIGDTDTPLSDIPGNDAGSENDADRGPAPSTDTEINPSDTPLAGGNGQASALGTALPIAGAALAAALLSIFLILLLRRRKRDGEGA